MRQLFNRLEAREQAREPLRIHLHPVAANQLQAIAARQQRAHLGGGKAFAVERHFHLKIEQRVLAEQRGRAGADPRRDRGPGWLPARPGARRAHHDAGRSELGHVGEELPGVAARPAQGVINLALCHHLLQPGAFGRGALHRHQQRQQLRFAPAIRKFFERARQRQVLRLAVRRQASRVSGEKCERRVRVFAVLGQIEMHAPDLIPRRVARLEKFLQ